MPVAFAKGAREYSCRISVPTPSKALSAAVRWIACLITFFGRYLDQPRSGPVEANGLGMNGLWRREGGEGRGKNGGRGGAHGDSA